MQRIGFTTLMLAIGFAAAPRVEAQSSNVLVCQDGQVTTTARGNRACDGHGGVNKRATAQARRSGAYTNGAYSNRGVYNGGVNNGATGTRGVYRGGVNNGSVYNGGVYNGGVYNGSNAQLQCADGSWSTVGVSGCNGRGGTYSPSNNRRWNDQQQVNGRRNDDRGKHKDKDKDHGQDNH